MKYFLISILFSFLLFSSCDSNEKKVSKDKSERVNKKWYNQKIVFPDSLILITGNNEKEKTNTHFSIIVFYDGNCSFCYAQLVEWKKITQQFKQLNLDVTFKFILSGSSIDLVKSNLSGINFLNHNLYFDSKNEFHEKYTFLLDSEYVHSSVLINRNNNILKIGNPTLSEYDSSNYIKLIKEKK